MPDRYFLDKAGVKTARMQGKPGRGHIDIGKQALAELGLLAHDDADVYTQMFALSFARVVEYGDGLVVVEHTHKLSPSQQRFLKSLTDAGKRVVFISIDR